MTIARQDQRSDTTGTDQKHLGHDDEFIARKVQLLDRITQNDFGETIRVDLRAFPMFS